MADWKIFYSDGTTIDSSASLPADAEARGVQAIVQTDDAVGREVVTKHDYYLRIDDTWVGVDTFGLIDFCLTQGFAKAGRCIPSKEYRKILEKALNDPGFPVKSARYTGERI